jgi:zinc protease
LKTETPLSSRRYAAALLYRILGEGYIFKGRILSKLRMEKGLIYTGGVFHVDLNHASYIFGELQTDNSKVSDAIDLLRSIVKDLRENGLNESELKFAKSNMKGRMLVQLRTSDDLCNFYFHKKLRGLGTTALEDSIERINSVTLEEVNAFAKNTLDEKHMSLVVIGGK